MTALQAPVSLQEMIAYVLWMRDGGGLDPWHNDDVTPEDALLALLQAIAAPDEAMVERLSDALGKSTGAEDAYVATSDRRAVIRAVLSALSGEAR